jgi:hypothetical protein
MSGIGTNVSMPKYLPLVNGNEATGNSIVAPLSTSRVMLLNNSIGPEVYPPGGT